MKSHATPSVHVFIPTSCILDMECWQFCRRHGRIYVAPEGNVCFWSRVSFQMWVSRSDEAKEICQIWYPQSLFLTTVVVPCTTEIHTQVPLATVVLHPHLRTLFFSPKLIHCWIALGSVSEWRYLFVRQALSVFSFWNTMLCSGFTPWCLLRYKKPLILCSPQFTCSLWSNTGSVCSCL